VGGDLIVIAGNTERGLWLQWMTVTTACLYIALQSGQFWLFLIGTCFLGIGQWLVLRKRGSNAEWWHTVTPVAFLCGAFIGGALGGNIQDLVDGVSHSPMGIGAVEPGRSLLGYLMAHASAGALLGAIVGGLQWPLLPREAQPTSWWLPANILGFAVCDVLSTYSALLGSAVFGAVTGAALVWCLRRRDSGRASPNGPVKKSGLAITSFALAILAVLSFVLVIILASAYPPAAGHRSPLTGPGGPAIFIMATVSLILGPAALLTGLVSLRRIRRLQTADAKSKPLAWIAVALGGICTILYWIAPIAALAWFSAAGKFGG